MLSTLKRANPYSTFPLDLQASFDEHKENLSVYLQLEDGEKIGKDKDEKYYKFTNSYAQLAMRYWYGENREKTIEYLDKDLGDYISFLDRLVSKIEQDILGVYNRIGKSVKEYNSDLIQGLYVLKETYNNQTWTTSDKKRVVAKIDSVILVLIDFKDKITTITKNNNKKMDTLLTINQTIQSFEI